MKVDVRINVTVRMLDNYVKKLLDRIKSLRLSLALMVAVIPIIAAGNLIPQRGRAAPWDIEAWQVKYPSLSKVVSFGGLDHVYTTWWFLFLFTVLFLNMSLVTWAMIKRTGIRARGLHRFTSDAPSYYSLGTLPPGKESMEAVERELKRRRYGITVDGGEIYARKGWPGIWGGTILHVGFVLILSGAVISGLFRFNGYMELGERQGFRDAEETYTQHNYGPLFPGHNEEVDIYLEGVKVMVETRKRTVLSTVTITDGGRRALTETIRVNEPIKYRGMKVYQSSYDGAALLFRVEGPTDGIAGYLNLPPSGEGKADRLFEFPKTPFQVKVEYTPGADFVSMEVRDKKAILYEGLLKAGEALDLDGWKLSLEGINRWVGLFVVYDWAVPVVFTGFLLSIVGVAVMGLFDPREIWLRQVEKEGRSLIEIVGWGRWRNMFLEEFEEMMEEVSGWKA